MKKLLVSLIALLGLSVAGLAFANGLSAGIKNSPHDFTDNVCQMGDVTKPCIMQEYDGSKGATDWNGRGEICRVCHVPHDHGRDTQYYLNGLLWNHALSDETYTMYNSAWSNTMDASQAPQPDGTAKMCLGCHDGTVALDTFDKYVGTAGRELHVLYDGGYRVSKFTDGANVDLRGTHPLSVVYDNIADKGLHPASNPMGGGGNLISDVLDNGKVQCSSCHDVHDSPGESVAGTHLLREANNVSKGNPSGLCLTCHNK